MATPPVEINACGHDHPVLRDLMKHVVPFVCGQWYELGLELLDPKYAHELDLIEADKDDTKTCCRKMFSKWLKTDKLASWDKVIEALTLVGLSSVASKIKQLLSQGYENLQEVTDNFKARYRRKQLDKSSTEQDLWPPFHSKSFTNLALVNQKNVQLQTKENTEMEANLRAKGHIDKIPELTSSIKLKNINQIFTPNTSDNQYPMSILIEGQPGIGKTTLAKEICLQWANNKLLTSDKLLILLMLRDPNVHLITNKEELMNYALPVDQVKPVLAYLHTTNGAGVTFIIDGFDELSEELRTQRTSFFRKLIEGDTLPSSRVVVTSRPYFSVCLHQHANKRIEILGFETSSKEQYIEEALKDFPSKLQGLKRHFQLYPNIDAMCYIPLSMAIIVFLCLLGSLPQTATEMFSSFIQHIVCRHLKRTRKIVEDMDAKQFPHSVQQTLQKLQKVAFDGLIEDKIVFTISDLPDTCKDDPTCYGLLQSVECFSLGKIGTPTRSFNFLHLGIQEYLAAKHVTSLSKNQVCTLLTESFFVYKIYKYDGDIGTCDPDSLGARLSNMWIMYCGLTSGQCDSLRQYLRTSTFNPFKPPTSFSEQDHPFFSRCDTSNNIDLIMTKATPELLSQIGTASDQKLSTFSQAILEDPVKVLYLFQCFQEAQNDSLCNVLSKSFDNDKIDLHNENILPHQMVSLGYFIAKSNRKWNELNLRSCFLGDFSINLLLYTMGYRDTSNNQEITAIDFSCNEFSAASSPVISKIIIQLQPQTVKLSYNNNITSVQEIGTAITGSNSVKILFMCENGLKTVTTEALTIFNMLNCLEKLVIDGNELGDDGALILSDGIKTSKTLKELNISGNEITATGAAAIANSLTYNNSLEILNMSGNAIRDNGAEAIACATANNNTLKELHIYCNHIGPDGFKAIGAALTLNTSLETLLVMSNEATLGGARAIANALAHNTSLEELDVSGNAIGDDGAIAIAQALMSNKNLKKLFMYRSKITATGAEAIANSLLHNTTLKELVVSGNDLGENGIRSIAAAISKNQTLQVLHIGSLRSQVTKTTPPGVFSFTLTADTNELIPLLPRNDFESYELLMAILIIRSLQFNNSITHLGLPYSIQISESIKRETELINVIRSKYSIPNLTVFGSALTNIYL